MGTHSDSCEKCGLCIGVITPYMDPDTDLLNGIDGCEVMLVGEAPGMYEDKEGVPFVGKTGQLLRSIVEDVGMHNHSIMYTNAVRCRPPENKTPTAKQIKCCNNRILEEIKQYDPRLVILLGNVPLKAVLGKSGITSWRGSTIEKDGRVYFPTYHPAYVLRNQNELPVLVHDFDTAMDLFGGNTPGGSIVDDYDITFVQTESEAKEMYGCIRHVGKCSFDTESNKGVKPYKEGNHLIFIQFACKLDYTDSLHKSMDEHIRKVWIIKIGDPTIDVYAKGVLADESIGKVAHFAKYDSLVCKAEWGIEPKPIVDDVMLLSYIIDPTPGRHGLKQLASQHLGMYDYDNELSQFYNTKEGRKANPKHGGDMSLVPIDIMLSYCTCDAIATIELPDVLRANDALTYEAKVLYEQLLLPGSSALFHMEDFGLSLDQEMAHTYTEIYELTKKEQYELLVQTDVVERYVAWRNKLSAEVIQTKRRLKPFEFNPRSSDQTHDIIFDPNELKRCTEETGKKRKRPYFKQGLNLTPTAYTQTGMPSAAWKDIKSLKDSDPFLSIYRYYKLLSDMLSKYLLPAQTSWVGRDGKGRSSYSEINTLTGRLSSSEPNFQNIPTPEKEPGTLLEKLPIRNLFTYTYKNGREIKYWYDKDGKVQFEIYPDEGCLLSTDYSAMELRTMAATCHCRNMLEMFTSGKDIHSLITTYLYNIPLDQVTKPLRYRAKWVNWTLLYGGDEHTLMRTYGLSEEEAKRLVATYFSIFPEIPLYRQETIAKVHVLSYSESKFGRRRYFPYINDNNRKKRSKAEREAVNMPIQSAASDILLCAAIIIDEVYTENSMRTRLCNTVHDSLMSDIYPGELNDAVHINKDVMENLITKYGPERFPGLDFSWFECPLKVDLEVGYHYGMLKEYEYV